MAASLESLLLVLDSNGIKYQEAMRHHALRKRRMGKMKKRRSSRLESSREPLSLIEKRVRALEKLLPSGESTGVCELFRETAEYIACLQAQVKVMRIMVKVLSETSDD
ncbi:hypothetical protein J5N97_018385 [Dioscorea zingiberensis]|uniref:Uncharacterized protein n=1 Tax=Dioscorea zingiberensis TaxID=325984 RepID=A0A9D5CQF6_9LILI|nr:hypothetical protein J5N97_018385 [Dioscorea zingiberensis]